MTPTPSASLHVQTPKYGDIKPSNALPPSPLTPQSNFSSMSSRLDVPIDSEHPTYETPAISASADEDIIDISAHHEPEGDAEHEESTHDPARGTLTDHRDALKEDEAGTGFLGLQCAPPNVLPPSPPLTIADTRDGAEGETPAPAAVSSSAQPLSVTTAPPHMREEDITNWRASMGEGEKQREEDVDDEAEGELEGEYDPYDLGYSPVTPVQPSAITGPLVHETKPNSSTARRTDDHPLRLDVNAPSPPPWEVISPPSTNENFRTDRLNGTLRGPNATRLRTSRPLIPVSAYYFGPPPLDSAYHTEPIGQIGVHHPREIIRIERDYSGGELVQFSSTYPLELEGRITPTQFLETINAINECLISAHSLSRSFVDNALAFFTLQLSKLVMKTHYEKEMRRLRKLIEEINTTLYNPVGLSIRWPRKVAFMFLEIEYY